jgi:hypothetical protein
MWMSRALSVADRRELRVRYPALPSRHEGFVCLFFEPCGLSDPCCRDRRATIDNDCLAGHIARSSRCEKNSSSGDILRFSDAAKRRAGQGVSKIALTLPTRLSIR